MAIALPNTIVCWSMLLWLVEVLLLREERFTTLTPHLDASPVLGMVLLGAALVRIVLGVWFVVVFLHCLGEAQGFSAWKALANVLLTGLVVLVPVILLVIAFL